MDIEEQKRIIERAYEKSLDDDREEVEEHEEEDFSGATEGDR